MAQLEWLRQKSNQARQKRGRIKSQGRRLPLRPQFLHRGVEAQYLPSVSSWPCCSTRPGVPVTAGLLQQTGSWSCRGASFPCQIGYTKMAPFVGLTCPNPALLLSLFHAASAERASHPGTPVRQE